MTTPLEEVIDALEKKRWTPAAKLARILLEAAPELLACLHELADGHSIEREERARAAAIARVINQPLAQYVGQFAQSIECGWIGKIIAVETINGCEYLKMQHVTFDIRWFVPEDVIPVPKKEPCHDTHRQPDR